VAWWFGQQRGWQWLHADCMSWSMSLSGVMLVQQPHSKPGHLVVAPQHLPFVQGRGQGAMACSGLDEALTVLARSTCICNFEPGLAMLVCC
jgi:hypothetical protein